MAQNINDLVDSNTIPSSRTLSDCKSYIEMSLDEYLFFQNRKEESDKLKAEKAIFNYHKKKGHVHSV